MSSSNRYRSLNLDLLRAYKTTATRYGRDAPFELVSVDVRRIGRIPQRGVSRSWGRSNVKRTTRVGYDYIHQHSNGPDPVHTNRIVIAAGLIRPAPPEAASSPSHRAFSPNEPGEEALSGADATSLVRRRLSICIPPDQ